MGESFNHETPEQAKEAEERRRKAQVPYPYATERNVDNMFAGYTVDRGFDDYLNILQLSEKDLEGKVILDVGSGEGRFVKEATAKGFYAIALDPAYKFNTGRRAINEPLPKHLQTFTDKLKEAAGLAKKTYTSVIASDSSEILLPDKSADIIINIFSAFFYCDSPESLRSIWQEQLRVLNDGGTLYIVTLSRSRQDNETMAIVTDSDPAYAEFNLSLAIDVDESTRKLMKETFKSLVDELRNDSRYKISFSWREGGRDEILKAQGFVLKIEKE